MTTQTSFRAWLQQKWVEHIDELDAWNLPAPSYGSDFYFRTYKWWLKREYKQQR